jgi:WD40 repeat protein
VQTGDVHAGSLAFSNDEKYLAAGTNRGQILIWRVAAPGLAPRQLNAHSHSVTALAFSPDGKSLASCSHDGTVKLSNLGTSASEVLLSDPRRELTLARTQLVFRPDGAMLAMASGNGTIRLWDFNHGADRDALVLGPFDEGIAAAAFSSDSSHLAAAGDEGTVRLWDLSVIEHAPLTVQSHQRRIFCLSFHPNGQLLAAGNEEGNVYVWQMVPGLPARVASIEGTVDNETRAAFSPDGKSLISVSIDGHLRFWSRDLTEEANLNHPIRSERFTIQDSLMSFAISPKGRLLATGSGSELVSGYVTIWDTRMKKSSSVGVGPQGPVFSVAFSPDGKLLAAGDEKGTIFVWNVESNALVTRINALNGIVWAVSFSPDGKVLVGGGNDGILRAWSVDNLTAAPRVIGDHSHAVFALAFSPDGRTLASAGLDTNIRLWNFDAPGALPRVLKGHEGYVEALAFHPSGRSLASASTDGSVRIWDLMHLEDVITLRGHAKGVYSVAFSPDGAELVSGGDDGTIRVWNPRTDVLADTICTQVWRNLSRDEWRHFLGEDIPYERTCPNLPVAPLAP